MILLRLSLIFAVVNSGLIDYGPIFGIGTDIEPLSECPVPDLFDVCIERCQTASVECIVSCDNDLMCISECIVEVTACMEDCPCQINCLDGCDDCSNPVCQCEDMESNPDWNMCIDHNGMRMGRCVHACNGNESCELDCLAAFKTRQMDCPCEQNCIGGCPCDNYPCTETTTAPVFTTTSLVSTTQSTVPTTHTTAVTTVSTSTTEMTTTMLTTTTVTTTTVTTTTMSTTTTTTVKTTTMTTTTQMTTLETTTVTTTTSVSSTTTTTAPVTTTTTPSMPWTTNSTLAYAVLVLNTRNSQNKPMTVDFNGNVDDDLLFEYGQGANIDAGLGATFMGEMWYFGGWRSSDKRQVSKIEDCTLVRQGNLPFNFGEGSCNTFLQPVLRILLCFDYNDPKVCHTFDGENYATVEDSKYSHRQTYGLGNYRGKAFTTGCNHTSVCKIATELLDMTTMKWSDGPDYPFASSSGISYYSATQTSDAVYIIGGVYTKDIVAKFKDDQWRRLANLNQGRYGHGSITVEGQTMIIGGYFNNQTPMVTEVWELENGTNKVIELILPIGHSAYGIALYVVDKDFCKK